MKVLFVLPNVGVGGVERVRLKLIEQFVADGIACRLALRRCRGELIDTARALAPLYELAPEGMHQFIPALARLIRRENPTHVVTAFADVGFLTWIALKLARSHAKWVHSVDQTHSSVGSRPGTWGHVRYWLENRMAGVVYRHVDAIVAVSDGLMREVLDCYHIDVERVRTIYNPVVPNGELPDWPQKRRTAADGPYVIVGMGRLVASKGFDVLVRAMPAVRGSWLLDIWGEGPKRARLETAIDASGMHDRIRLRGYTSEPYAALRDADLFVLSSRHEGLGNALIEALACQCQIVATDCPHGPREILKGDKLGQLVPVDDAKALAGAITRAIDGGAYVDPMLLLDRARQFSCSESCLKWESLLRSL